MRYPLYAGNFLIWSGIVLYGNGLVRDRRDRALCRLLPDDSRQRGAAHARKVRSWLSRALPEVPALWPSRRAERCRAGFRDRFGCAPELRFLTERAALLLLGIVKFRVVHLTWGIPSYWLVATGVALALFLAGWLPPPAPGKVAAEYSVRQDEENSPLAGCRSG
ncbi:MAG: hypothetical protein ACLR76_08600 [Alistipes sp.]